MCRPRSLSWGRKRATQPSLLARIYREGHEIGNHTWTHPDISNISPRQLQTELNMTERLFAAELGVKPLLFRPPYSIDTRILKQITRRARLRPLKPWAYLIVGARIDPMDWATAPKPSATEIVDRVIHQLNKHQGNIILLHDGGGDRQETVRALPLLIHQLRQEATASCRLPSCWAKAVPISCRPSPGRNAGGPASITWDSGLYALLYAGIVLIFLAGDALIIARLLSLASLATFNRFRRPRNKPAG